MILMTLINRDPVIIFHSDINPDISRLVILNPFIICAIWFTVIISNPGALWFHGYNFKPCDNSRVHMSFEGGINPVI